MAGTIDVTGRNSTTGNPELIKSTTTGLWTQEQAIFALERNRGTANAYGAIIPECNYTAYNPHTAAAVGTLTAGAAGATEALITASPCIVYGIEWASDTAAGSVLLYDKAATGGTSIPYPVLYAAGQQFHGPLGKKFNNGLTIIGTAAGVCCNVLWRLQ